MAKRMPIKLFVQELEAAYRRGDGYIMASYGQNPRTGYLDLSVTKYKSSWKPNGWYYTQYSGKQREQALRWREKATRVWDCNGMAEGIYEIWSGECINARARNNYASWCGEKGKGLIPRDKRVPGAAVFWGSKASEIHHVGYLFEPVVKDNPDGDWYIIEARGVMYGVVKTKLNSRKPNFWGYMTKYFDYDSELSEAGSSASERVLKNGDEGEDVRQMQQALIELGYDLGRWGADGDFGDATEYAVKEFQRYHGLEPDGEVGPLTREAIDKALSVHDAPVENPKMVEIVGGNCYVRTAPNTSGRILGVAHEGAKLPFAGVVDEETKWLLVEYKNENAWVSGKYGRLVEA